MINEEELSLVPFCCAKDILPPASNKTSTPKDVAGNEIER
jgi:hypothetical protein